MAADAAGVFGASTVSLALTALIFAIGWSAMPETVAVHAGTRGPDRWLSREAAAREALWCCAVPLSCATLAVAPWRRPGRAAMGWSLTWAALAVSQSVVGPLLGLVTVTNALGR